MKKKNNATWRKRLKHFKKRNFDVRKGLALLPHIFTFGNAFFGFCSLIFTARGEFETAAHFILFGALMDMLDGRIARFFGVSSLFGVQIDSFSDAMSFCCAPAFLFYRWQLYHFGVIGIIISFLFFMAGIIRLSRFNLIHEQQTLYFLGFPSTMAGCFLATIVLNASSFENRTLMLISSTLILLLFSYLMISALHFPTFKQRLFKERKNWHFMLLTICFAVIAVMQINMALLLLLIGYLGYSTLTMKWWEKKHLHSF